MNAVTSLFPSAFLSASLLFFAGSVGAAPNDPSGGLCDGLDASGGLFSTCIQAHSAANRVDHLINVGASDNAVSKAQAALDKALAQFAQLGGGVVPGFAPICPCWPGGIQGVSVSGDIEQQGTSAQLSTTADFYSADSTPRCFSGATGVNLALTAEEAQQCVLDMSARIILDVVPSRES